MRTFRLIELGVRELNGVRIPSGVRVEENKSESWVYHSTQPDLTSAKSLLSSMSAGTQYSSIRRDDKTPLVFSFQP